MAATEPTVKGVGQLRVHGIAGTPASRILKTDPTLVDGQQTASPGRAGRSTPRATKVWQAVDPIPEGFVDLRAYRWSALTSGTATHALHVLLAPMLLVNVSAWMTPSRSGVARAMTGAALRISALAASGFMAVGLIWAFYVMPSTGCGLLSPENNRGLGLPESAKCIWFFRSGVNGTVAVAVVCAIVVVPALWQFYKASANLASGSTERPEPGDWSGYLGHFESSGSVQLLRLIHIAFLIDVVVASVAISRRSPPTLSVALAVGLLLIIVAGQADSALDKRPPRWLLIATSALITAIIGLISALVDRSTRRLSGPSRASAEREGCR